MAEVSGRSPFDAGFTIPNSDDLATTYKALQNAYQILDAEHEKLKASFSKASELPRLCKVKEQIDITYKALNPLLEEQEGPRISPAKKLKIANLLNGFNQRMELYAALMKNLSRENC